MVLEYNSQKPFPQQNGFGVLLTETISTAKWFWYNFIQNIL